MKGRPSRPVELVRTPVDLLGKAERSAVSAISDALQDDDAERDRSLDALSTVTDAVRALLASDTERSVASPSFDPWILPAVQILRREILALAESPETAAAAVELLRAVESVRLPGSVEAPHRASPEEDLRARLRAPDAFQLLVEVAHDLRSPLTSILFLSETLRDGHSGPVTDVQRSQLGLIYSAAFGLASIASDVMDLARREHDTLDIEAEPYSLRELLSNVERLVDPIVEEKGLELRIELPERSKVTGHPHAVSRVLLNLTTNALKFTDEGWVEIGAKARPPSHMEFYVQDTGRGIPEKRRAELFRPFKSRSGESPSGPFFSGSGVGLSIARRLVRAMGSDLELESSDDEGTRFWFVVPIDAPLASSDPR